jgi:hypothetical protein
MLTARTAANTNENTERERLVSRRFAGLFLFRD